MLYVHLLAAGLILALTSKIDSHYRFSKFNFARIWRIFALISMIILNHVHLSDAIFIRNYYTELFYGIHDRNDFFWYERPYFNSNMKIFSYILLGADKLDKIKIKVVF